MQPNPRRAGHAPGSEIRTAQRRVRRRLLHDPAAPGPGVRRQPADAGARDRRHVRAQGQAQSLMQMPTDGRSRDGRSDVRVHRPRRSRSGMSQIRVRMTARAVDEPHRASSQLELLFDLTFVVAISRITAPLADSIANGDVLQALTPFLQVFFSIWWAWMNYTWFASSYDTDDVVYRLLTLVQIAGVLVLAAGVPAALSDNDLRGITVGYLIMRVGLITLWLRAAIEDPTNRGTALRYAAGIAGLGGRLGAPPRPRRIRRAVTSRRRAARSSSASWCSSSRYRCGRSAGRAPAGTRITSPNGTDCSRSSFSAKCIFSASSEVEDAIEGRGCQRCPGDDRDRRSRRDVRTVVAVLPRAGRARVLPTTAIGRSCGASPSTASSRRSLVSAPDSRSPSLRPGTGSGCRPSP